MDNDTSRLDSILEQIEFLLYSALQDLKTYGKTEVDFEHITSLLNSYSKFYEPQDACNKRWDEYIQEIISLLKKGQEKSESIIRNLMATDQAFTAYNKAQNAYKLEGE